MRSAPLPLTRRLAALSDAVAPGSRVADVGTDHGLLPLGLAASGRASFCLATERTAERLAGVLRPGKDQPWASLLAYRAGDGLDPIAADDRIDTAVLAGLGGRTITGILTAGLPERPSIVRLVLQPRSEPASLRAFLSAVGWVLVGERLTEDGGRFHLTLTAERGDDTLSYRHDVLGRQDLLAAGPLLVRSGAPEALEAWRLERERLAGILSRKGSGPSMERAREGLARAERILAIISRRGG